MILYLESQLLLLQWFAANAVSVVERLQEAGSVHDGLLEVAFDGGPNSVQPYGAETAVAGRHYFVSVLYDQQKKRIVRLSYRSEHVDIPPTVDLQP